MEFLSTVAGGSAPSGRATQTDYIGARPDVRFVINDKACAARSKDAALVERWKHKGLELLDASAYGPDVYHITWGTGSSSMVDTDGDVFHKSAQIGMARDSIDLNVLLNHIPTVPWNIAGSILATDVDFLTTHDGNEFTCLKLVNDIEQKHPDAWRTYEMIAGIDCRARKLGYSVGCLYTDAQPRRTASGIYKGVDVYEVLPVEFSIVTMPANRLAWIETIGRDLQEKGILPKTKNFNQPYATSQPVVEVITDWMDFGPIDGPRIERVAKFFEQEYDAQFSRRPRSA